MARKPAKLPTMSPKKPAIMTFFSSLLGRTLITNRIESVIIVLVIFICFSFARFEFGQKLTVHNASKTGNFNDVVLSAIFFFILFSLQMIGKFNTTEFLDNPKQAELVYVSLNPDTKDAFEDLLKFTTIIAIALRYSYNFVVISSPHPPAYLIELVGSGFVGSAGLIFLLSLTRQAMLILARIGRFCRLQLHPDSDTIG